MGDSEGPGKRQKRGSSYKAKAFEKFQQLKSGKKFKYEVEELQNVYDVVEEKEYVKQVLARQNEDWIVDDHDNGYIEDGREVFDDDLDTESIEIASKSGKGIKRKKKALSENTPKGSIQSMLSSMPAKKKPEKVTVSDDNILADLLDEIDSSPSSSKGAPLKPKRLNSQSFLAQKVAAKQYMKSFRPTHRDDSSPAKVSLDKSKVLKELQNTAKEQVSPEMRPSNVESKCETSHSNLSNCGNKTKVIKTPDKDVNMWENMWDCIDEKKEIEVSTQQSQKIEVENSQTSVNSFSEMMIDEFESEFDVAAFAEEEKLALDNDSDIADESDITMEEKLEMSEEFMTEFTSNWNALQEEFANESVCEIEIEKSNIPLLEVDNKKVFRFFWWDAFEDSNKRPGTVLLFGKTYSEDVKAYVSCCVIIEDIQRRLFVLPRRYVLDGNAEPTDTPVTPQNLYAEISSIMQRLRIANFRSRYVKKKYAFSPEVPKESEYMEIRYSAKDEAIDEGYSASGKTFSKIFGSNSSYLELFLLERKIKGPCWLDVDYPEAITNPVSWCKLEVNCQKPVNISVAPTKLPPPPLVVAAINMRCILNPKTYENEIVMLSCLIQNAYAVDKPQPTPLFQQHFCVFASPTQQMLPVDMHLSLGKLKYKVQKMDNEKALLNYFLVQFSKIDADLIIGHDLLGYGINLLCDRLIFHKNYNYSRMGKLKRRDLPTKYKLEKQLFLGRLVCDIKVSAKELLKLRTYDLGALCSAVLKLDEDQRIDVEPDDVIKLYQSSEEIIKLVNMTLQDTSYMLKIMYELSVIPLALQITNIAGNVMSKTLLGGRSQRNEFLLLHAFHEKDYIVPDKVENGIKSNEEVIAGPSKKKPTYAGGLVLDPKIGFYDKLILLMDFNSLYPSIIQEYNICFTTVSSNIDSDNDLFLPDKNMPPGILPTEIRKLVESRREVKKLMKNADISSDLRMQYSIRQMALKLTANSMYGCLGFANSRFYAKSLAALVTHKGREILTNTRDLVQKMNLDVIYGDTDSIMINTNIVDFDQVYKIGHKVKQEVNRIYKHVELDIDGVFKYLLLLKKKKYAAVTITKTPDGKLLTANEYKGLDIVRRDWSQLASEAGKFILEHILSDQPADNRIENIYAHLIKLKEDLENNRVPEQLLVITKQLTKDLRFYTDKNSLPHVLVALRYNKLYNGHLRKGDTVPYIICDDGSNKPATQRAYHIEELRNSETLKVDVKYYLSQQIHPVVSRICEPIESIDAYKLADCLGIDPSTIKQPVTQNQRNSDENITRPEIRFKNADKFVFPCKVCKVDNIISGSLINNAPFLDKCANKDCSARPVDYIHYIQNHLTKTIRSYIKRYYSNQLICEDPSCPNETSRLPLKFSGKYPICNRCQANVMYKKYTENNLHTQLRYFQYIFDLSRLSKKPLLEKQTESGYHMLNDTVLKYLNHSEYSVVNLGELFFMF